MQFNALVEDYPDGSPVYFRELPGCVPEGKTADEAIAAAPRAVEEYLRWLKKNDVQIIEDDGSPVTVVVQERLKPPGGQISPRFEADLPPPDDMEIDNALNVAGVLRAQILELYEETPIEKRERVLQAGDWSLEEHLWHVLESEAWYISRLSEQPEDKFASGKPADLSMALFDNAMDTELFLRGLSPEQRRQVFVQEGEEWTAAKVLRRLVGHLGEHFPWMQELARI